MHGKVYRKSAFSGRNVTWEIRSLYSPTPISGTVFFAWMNEFKSIRSLQETVTKPATHTTGSALNRRSLLDAIVYYISALQT